LKNVGDIKTNNSSSLFQRSRFIKAKRFTAYVAGGLVIILGLIGFLAQFNEGAASSSAIFGYVLAAVFVVWGTLLCLAVRFHYRGGVWSFVGITLVALATIQTAFMYDVDLPRKPFISLITGLSFVIVCALIGCCCLVVGHRGHQMDITVHSTARPMAVKIAIILLALDCGAAIVMDVVNFQLSHYVTFGGWLIEDILFYVLVWCAFCGKNWARWFVAIWTVLLEICISPFAWVSFHRAYSTFGAVWFWLGWLLDIIAVIALFHPSSNRWFRGHRLPSDAVPEPTPTSS
jgi:hypothetical protein